MKASEKIENIYTLLPRFVNEGNSQEINYIAGKYLSPITKDFQWNNHKFILVILPAAILKNGKAKHYLPMDREKLVEEILRKLAVESNINFCAKELILYFSLSQIIQDLEFAKEELELAIEIIATINYILLDKNGEFKMTFRPIEELMTEEKDGEIYYRAQFSEFFFKRTEPFDFAFIGKQM